MNEKFVRASGIDMELDANVEEKKTKDLRQSANEKASSIEKEIEMGYALFYDLNLNLIQGKESSY